MNLSSLPITKLDQTKHINLTYPLPTNWEISFFNKTLIGCLSDMSRFVDFSTISLEFTSSHSYAVIFSRYFVKELGSFDVKPYYPNAKKINVEELTPYHSWEIIDDTRDLHLKQEGPFTKEGLSFHLYPQLYSARIFEKVTQNNSKFEFYQGDDLYHFSLAKKNGSYWFIPSNAFETANLPFGVNIWYTENKIELDLSIYWNVFAIEGTPSNNALQAMLLNLVKKGWEFDKDSDIRPKEKSAGSQELSALTIDGFIEIEYIVEVII